MLKPGTVTSNWSEAMGPFRLMMELVKDLPRRPSFPSLPLQLIKHTNDRTTMHNFICSSILANGITAYLALLTYLHVHIIALISQSFWTPDMLVIVTVDPDIVNVTSA